MLRQTVEPASAAATATATRIAPAGRSARTAARRTTRTTGTGARMNQRRKRMVRNRWRQELRKPRSEGGATICEKHDFALEHYSDPEMGYEVGEALRQAKDDGQRMEKRLQELGEEANNLEECLRDAESERDRLRARVAEVEAENAERDAAHKADADLAASLHLENAGLRAEVERNVTSVLVDHARGVLPHRYEGACPDSVEGPDVRDPECPVCRAIDSASGRAVALDALRAQK